MDKSASPDPKGGKRPEIPTQQLVQIKERLRKGSLTPEDMRTLAQIVEDTERASKALRAAIVE